MRATPTTKGARARASVAPTPPPPARRAIPTPPDPTEGRKAAFLQELQKVLGVVEVACTTTGIDRTEYDDWMANDPSFVKRVKRIEVIAYDFAKAKLMELVDKKSPGAVIHLLKTLDAQQAKADENHIPLFSFETMDDEGAPTLPAFSGEPETVRRKVRFLRALEALNGVITHAARAAHISREIVVHWRRNDPVFAEAEKAISEVTLDGVERELFKQIGRGEVAATLFYLKTKGKHRGYVERTELSGPNGGPVSTLHMTLEDAKQDLPPDTLRGIYKSLMVAEGQHNGADAAAFFTQGRNGKTPRKA